MLDPSIQIAGQETQKIDQGKNQGKYFLKKKNHGILVLSK